ncbi:hypothetical protein [Streptomyces sp. NPDC029526]|uniref:hypothetical protein n=1 Tax=Streptomyces sp. NPDC029526 TaxID=3155728 RepID=UPI0033CD9AEF
MTQSGQGEEPSARPAREGIVLPSDGGDPLVPGLSAPPAGPVPGAPGADGGQAPSAPSGGRTWGEPWGPGQQASAPVTGQDWQPSTPASPSPGAQQWGGPAESGWGGQDGRRGPGPLPPEGAPPASHGGPPAHGAHPQGPDAGYGAPAPRTDAYGAPDGGHGGAPAPQDPYGSQNPYGSHDPYAPQTPQAPHDPYAPHAPRAPHAPHTPHPGYGAAAAQPQVSPEGATQYLPPVPAGPGGGAADGAEGATQFLPPVPAAPVDEGPTQYIPPIPAAGPGALPPEMSAGPHPASPPGHHPQGPAGHGAFPPAGDPDAEATQYIAPVTDQGPAPYGAPAGDDHRQPPAEFDNLFRSDEGPAGATQQMPRIEDPVPGRASVPPSGPGGGGSRRASGPAGRGGGRTGSRVPLLAAVGVGIAVLGVGAGALLGGGGGSDDGDRNQPVSASAPASTQPSPTPTPTPTVDPARQQAVELDKLLAHSGESRATVINAVADVKQCKDLAKAAKDLRDAAGQRNQLVTDLSALSVDKLPDHQALTTALTKAWKASAAADNHYAAWADQTAGKRGCRKGQARTTGRTQAGNRASGTATAEKGKAARLWNAIAKQYGLTERQPAQL